MIWEAGAHQDNSDATSVLEAVSLVLRQEKTDHPVGVSAVLCGAVRVWEISADISEFEDMTNAIVEAKPEEALEEARLQLFAEFLRQLILRVDALAKAPLEQLKANGNYAAMNPLALAMQAQATLKSTVYSPEVRNRIVGEHTALASIHMSKFDKDWGLDKLTFLIFSAAEVVAP
jgi:hypothetical protein